jgi:hypothetical protein
MAADYYQRYPERFGKKTEVSYEIVGSTRTLDPSERAALLRAVERAADQSDWRGWAAALAAEGQPVTYTRTSASDRLIHPKLREFLEGLKPERSSPPAFVQGRVYVARVVGKTEHPARPFEEVQRDIERLLGPAQVSAAIERAARDVMKTTEVELVDAPRPPERGSLARKTEGKQP